MNRVPAKPFPPDADRVRERINAWRQTREKRTRMPEDLWQAAIDLARDHGAWATSRALRVRYDTLSLRLKESSATAATGRAGFVELPTPPSVAMRGQATVIELSRADGTRLTMRLGEQGTIEVRSLIDAFCRAQ